MNTTQLLTVLQNLKPALSSFDYVPILKHFCFSNGQVYAYNDVICIQTESPISLNYALPGDLLINLLSSFRKEFDIEEVEDGIILKSGRNKSKFSVLPKEDYLFELPDLDEADSMVFSKNVIAGIKSCLISVSDDMTHPEHMVIYLNESGIYSTDNKTLSKGSSEHIDADMILSKEFCEHLVRVQSLVKAEAVDIYYSDDFIVADFGKYRVFSKQLGGVEPLDFEEILENFNLDPEVFAEVPKDFDESLARCLLILSNDKEISISVARRNITLNSVNASAKIEDSVSFQKAFESDEFMVDAALVKRALSTCKEISFQKGAVLLRNSRGFTHLISHYQDN